MPEEEFEGLGDLLSDDGPEMTLADPALMEAGEAIANTIWNAGTEAWNVLLNRGVLYTSGGADYNEPESLLPDDLGECLVTTVEWSGDREGALVFIMPVLFAKGVVAYMMALMMGTEAFNQFLGQAAQALRADPGGNVDLKATGSQTVNFSEKPPTEVIGTDFILCGSGQCTIEGMSPINVYTLISPAVTGVDLSIGESDAATDEDVAEAVKDADKGAAKEDVDRVLDIRLPVLVNLADRKMLLSEIMSLVPGSIVEFRKSSEDPLDLAVGNVVIARGEAVIIEEHFGLQIGEMLDVRRALVQDFSE